MSLAKAIFLASIFAATACLSRTAAANNHQHVITMHQAAEPPIDHPRIPVNYTPNDRKRFLEKTKQGEGGCILWTASRQTSGYGVFTKFGRNLGAHVVSWEMESGIKAFPKQVQHTCNVKLCVNPSHLKIGSHKENSEWMVACGRSTKGDLHYTRRCPELIIRGSSHINSKLKECDVLEIRNLYSNGGVGFEEVAKKYKVSYSVVRDIVNRKMWSHVA